MRKAGIPATNADGTAEQYQRLSESQNRVVAMIAARFPNVLYPAVGYGAIPTCTTTDNQLFTFGTDANGYPIALIGKASFYRSLNDIPTNPMVPGLDFTPVGATAIRIPNNRTEPGPLYYVGIQQPADINATNQPALLPEASRELIVLDAARQWAQEFGRSPSLYALMQQEWNTAWPQWCATWRTSYRGGGALRVVTGLQLALSTQYQYT